MKVKRIRPDCRWAQRTTMKLLLVLLTFVLIQSVRGADENCWWTGCEPTTWETRGCSSGTEQKAIVDCEGGNKYKCCPNTDTTGQTTTASTLPYTPGCWWTGCQFNGWAVRGCNSEGMEMRMTLDCYNGNHYQCCPVTKESAGGSTNKIEN